MKTQFKFKASNHSSYSSSHEQYDNLLGTKSKHNNNPMYLEIIKYVYNSTNEYFTRNELISHSQYTSKCHELFASFNRNEIIIYDKHLKVLKRGKNFIKWVKEFYPELLIK